LLEDLFLIYTASKITVKLNWFGELSELGGPDTLSPEEEEAEFGESKDEDEGQRVNSGATLGRRRRLHPKDAVIGVAI